MHTSSSSTDIPLNITVERLALLFWIWKVLGLKSGTQAGYTYWRCSVVSSVPLGKWWVSTFQQAMTTSFHIIYNLSTAVILPFDAKQRMLLLNNKTLINPWTVPPGCVALWESLPHHSPCPLVSVPSLSLFFYASSLTWSLHVSPVDVYPSPSFFMLSQ